MKTRTILTIGILSGLLCLGLLFARPACAQDAAPFAGHCFGAGTSTCLVPQLSFDVTRIRLNGPDAGTLEAGAVPIGAGYALLFAYDQWYTFGPAIHAIADFSQADATFFQLAGMVTAFRYAHAGVVWARTGSETQWFAAAGLTLPIDLVTTAVADRKAKAVRTMRAVQAEKDEAAKAVQQ
jgi:hypothetical protein